MPCLLALLAVFFPRIAVVLLWLFTSFFNNVYQGVVIPILGFLFLPLTLIVYTYLLKTHTGPMTTQGMVFLFIAVILDLGLVGGSRLSRRR
jgi:hypothetical protein